MTASLLILDTAFPVEPWSGYVIPAAPTLAQPTPTSSTIPLSWTGPAGTYTLQRAPVTNGTPGTFAPIYTGTTASYTDGGLTFNTTYAYRVAVTVNGATSNYSNVRQATTATGSTGPVAVSVDAQRNTAVSNIPAGSSATDYEYQFRPAPTVDAQRVADISQTLAAGESASDYEYQVR
jgi:hypothetical protein